MATNEDLTVAVRALQAASENDDPAFDSAMVALGSLGLPNVVEAFCRLGLMQAELLAEMIGDSKQSVLSGLAALVSEMHEVDPRARGVVASSPRLGNDMPMNRLVRTTALLRGAHPTATDRRGLYLLPGGRPTGSDEYE